MRPNASLTPSSKIGTWKRLRGEGERPAGRIAGVKWTSFLPTPLERNTVNRDKCRASHLSER